MIRAIRYLFFGLILAATLGFQDGKQGGAKIEFFSDSYDFGEIEEGTVVEHVFKFKNSGNAALEIKKVKGS